MPAGSGKRKSFAGEYVGLKLISLFLAILLELYFYSADNSVRASLQAKVEVKNIPPGMTIVKPEDHQGGIPVSIEVRGPRPLIEQVRTAIHNFTVEYPDTSPPTYNVVLNPRQIWLPPGVELLEVRPPSLSIDVERLLTRELPVKVDYEGALREGFRLERVAAVPATVIARGPARFVESLKEILTKRLDVRDVVEPKRMEVPLIPPDPRVTLSTAMSTVEFVVTEIPAEKSFDNINVQVVAPHGFAASVQPTKAKVTLGGPAPQLDAIDPKGLIVRADARSLSEGKSELPLEADLPAGVSVVETKPKRVTVTLVKQ